MKIAGENGLGSVLKLFLQIGFYIGIAILIALPFGLNLLGFNLNASAFVIYPNGIILLLIAYQFIKLFDSLKKNNPFCKENIKILKNAGKLAIIEAVLWIIDLLYEIVLVKSEEIILIATLGFLAVLFIGVFLALYILSELFKEAVEYKAENELTI